MVTRQESAHAMRRMGFGGTPAEIDAWVPKTRAAFVSTALLARQTAPTKPGFLTDPALGDWEKINATRMWWFDRMSTSSFTDTATPSPIVERMTLFWHNHFATSADKVFHPQFIYDQIALYRANAMGSFRTLCKKMAVAPAMLFYLDNESNTKDAPNQNFARELLELFVLGVGNYTEADVLTAAYAWTGHNIDWRQNAAGNWYPRGYKFFLDRHDTTPRTFMGVTQVWDGPALIDFLLDNPATRQIVARFIVRKLWTWLVYPDPAQTIVDTLANTFIAKSWNIKALLTAMFNRAEFWSATAMNGAIRGPIEYTVATAKACGRLVSDQIHPEWFTDGMGQSLLYPPNVSGWRPNAYWVNTSAATTRADFAGYVAWRVTSDGDGINPAFLNDICREDLPVAQRPAPATVVAQALDRFSIIPPSPETVARLTAWCTTNRHQWTNAEPWNYWGERVHLMQLILTCPDFQLN